MGLGKSLMMISAIVSSLSSAVCYALSFTSKPGGSDVAAKSTLIVVPSACEYVHLLFEIFIISSVG